MIIKDIYLLERSEEVKISGREEVNINLSLEKAPLEFNTKILGKIIDKCDDGIKDATVKIFTLDYTPVEHTTTNCRGDFVFENIIPPGEYYVIATAPTYKVSKSYKVTLKQNSIVQLNIQLDREEGSCLGVLYGYITDGFGKGLNNATVKVFSYDNPDNLVAITHTNDDGEYLVYSLIPGKYFITAEKTGYYLPSKVLVTIDGKKFKKLNLALSIIIPENKGTISGQITSSGVNVPYAIVSLYKIYNDRTTLIQIKVCNEEGVYLFGDVQPGSYIVKSNKSEEVSSFNID